MQTWKRTRRLVVISTVAVGALAEPALASNGRDGADCGRRGGGNGLGLPLLRGLLGGGQGGGDSLTVVGLGTDGKLLCFKDDRPGNVRTIGAVTGLEDNDVLVGIDYRVSFTDAAGVANGVPAGGTLYGLGRNGGVYTIDASTATATKRSQLSTALTGAAFGIDFNPTVDRLRIVSDTGQNLRVNVDSGSVTVDGALNRVGAAATGVTGVAYTNNDTDPATATTLYDIDTTADVLAIQSPPNDGGLANVGALGVDAASPVGFDLYSTLRRTGTSTVGSTVEVRGLASLTVGGTTGLYRITPFSGRAVSVGNLSIPVADIAIPLSQL